MTTFYILNGRGPYPSVSIQQGPRLPGGPWYSGYPLQIEVPEPLEYTLAVHPNYEDEDEGVIVSPSNPKVLMNAAAFPVMRKDLLAILQNEGVTLETFEAHLIDEINNVVHTNYVAFNVVGFIAELDPPYMRTFSRPTQYPSSAANHMKMFRLGECNGEILVEQSLKAAIEASGIEGVEFYTQSEWASA